MKILYYIYNKNELYICFCDIVGLGSYNLTQEEFNKRKNIDIVMTESFPIYLKRTKIIEKIFKSFCIDIEINWKTDTEVNLKGSLNENVVINIIDKLKSIDINTIKPEKDEILIENNKEYLLSNKEIRNKFKVLSQQKKEFISKYKIDEKRDVSILKILSIIVSGNFDIIDYNNINIDSKDNILPLSISLEQINHIDDNSFVKLIYHGIICHPKRDYLVLTYLNKK
jgi:hypothetical protein